MLNTRFVLTAMAVSILFSVLFAGWGEETEVRVLDGNFRLLPGADVNITWEISHTRGMATTRTKQTDENGRATFLLTNVEFNDSGGEDITNYVYTVNAKYQGVSGSEEFQFGNGTMPRTVQLNVYDVLFNVQDKSKNPLMVGIILDGAYKFMTNANGAYVMVVGKGNHTIRPDLPDVKDVKLFEVDNNTNVDFAISLYNFGIRAIDDSGQPVVAQVYVGSQSKKTGEDGWAKFSNLTNAEVVARVNYGRYKKSAPVNLDFGNSTTVIFDTHPPVISNVYPEWKGQNLQIRAQISDLGEYASGLRNGNASIELYYSAGETEQKKVPMYTVGYNLYEGLIPVQSGNSIRYVIQATDADGNFATAADTFVAPTSEPTDLGEANSPPAQPEFMGVNFSNLPYVLGGAVLLLAAIFIAFYRKRNLSESDDERGSYQYPEKKEAPDMDSVPKKTSPPKPPQ